MDLYSKLTQVHSSDISLTGESVSLSYIKSKKLIHLYCPKETVQKVERISRAHGLKLSINTNNKNYFTNSIVLYHDPTNLSLKDQATIKENRIRFQSNATC